MHGSILKATKDLRMNRSSVTKLLRDPRIAKRIQEIQAAEFQDLGITAERVKEELARVAFASAAGLFDEEGRLIPVHELPDDVAATITGIDVEVQQKMRKDDDGNLVAEDVVTKKIKRADKMAALALLARHFKIVGAEDDGVNQLATALADRLNRAKRRMGEDFPLEDVDDARYVERVPEPATAAEEARIIVSAPPAAEPDSNLWD
jgi:phage terminase small subunit